MKHLLLLLVSLCILDFTHGSSITVTGKVSGVWNVDTVNVAGDLRINADTSLVILPGTRIIFHGSYQIWVLGVIRATGNAANPIIFTVYDTTGFADTLSNAGGWHGFLFDQLTPDTDTSFFSFCHFEYGKAVAQDTTGINGGVIRIYNWNKVVISDCDFFHNLAYKWGGAVYAKYADIILTRNTFRENRCGPPTIPYGYGGAVCAVHSNPVLQYCLFENNSSTGIGGGASFEFSDPVLQFNIFHQNLSGLGGGFAYLRSSPAHVASNNLVVGNSALFFGGGISIIRCNVGLSNNTIVNNQASYGGGLYANDSACPSNYNTIFYGNVAGLGQEVYIWDVRSAPNFYYCNVAGGVEDFQGSGGQQGYHGEFENNLDTIPGFTGTGEYPYSLLNNSPFIDRGTPDTTSLQVPGEDLAGNDRIYNNRIDIGAYEWNPVTWVNSPPEASSGMSITPNPVRSDFSVSFTPDYPGIFSLTVFNSNGKKVWHSADRFLYAGSQIIYVYSSESGIEQWPAGHYFLRITGESIIRTKPFLILR